MRKEVVPYWLAGRGKSAWAAAIVFATMLTHYPEIDEVAIPVSKTEPRFS